MTEQNFLPTRPRISEPSTWSGFAAVVLGVLFGSKAPELATPEFAGAVVAVISGVVSIFKREGK